MADMASDPRRAASLQEAVAEYRRMTNQKQAPARPCPACGGPLQKGKQYCPKCADRRRKASNREAQARTRQGRGLLSAEVPKNTPEIPTN